MRQPNPLTEVKNKIIKTVSKLEKAKDDTNFGRIKKIIDQVVLELTEEINKLP